MQIQVRDGRGNPIPLCNIRISLSNQSDDEAIYDVFTDMAGNTGWPIPYWPSVPVTLYVNTRNVLQPYEPVTIPLPGHDQLNDQNIEIVLGKAESHPNPNPGPLPPANASWFGQWPRVGCTIHQLIFQPEWDVLTFAKKMQDIFGERWLADVNLWTAPWPAFGDLPGIGLWPWPQHQDGRWDLKGKNNAWLDRALYVKDVLNGHGGLMKGIGPELYSFSDRKKNLPFDQNRAWPRYNTNGVNWPSDDSSVGTYLPDWVIKEFYEWCLPHLDGPGFILQLALEMPEKGFHERLRDLAKRISPGVKTCVNRNEDTPGQYLNMKIGQGYDCIEFHGWREKSFLMEPFNPTPKELAENPVGARKRPWNFKQFFDNKNQNGQSAGIDFRRVIGSSDGARRQGNAGLDRMNPYEWNGLKDVARTCFRAKASWTHQSRAKLSPPAALNVEWDFMGEIAAIARSEGVL